MKIRTASPIMALLKKPELQFLLIFLIPFTAFFFLNYVNVSPENRIYIILAAGSLILILTFQTIYSIYAHYRMTQAERTFLSVTSHQMRTPLAALHWILSEMSQKGVTDENRKEMGRIADVSVTKLNNIIDAFSTIAKIEEGQVLEEMAHLDICDLVEQAVADAEPVGKQYGVSVSFEGPCDELWVMADPVKMEIVFSNLINNGIKYNHRGGAVAVGARKIEGGKYIEVMVRDTGIGISPHDQERIFERFFRGDEAQKMNKTGAGLGLYITKELIRQHRGTIWLESIPGKGTTFHFTLPSDH